MFLSQFSLLQRTFQDSSSLYNHIGGEYNFCIDFCFGFHGKFLSVKLFQSGVKKSKYLLLTKYSSFRLWVLNGLDIRRKVKLM